MRSGLKNKTKKKTGWLDAGCLFLEMLLAPGVERPVAGAEIAGGRTTIFGTDVLWPAFDFRA